MPLENFDGVVHPIDLLHLGNHKILVMPRWGDYIFDPWFSTIHEVLELMCWLLKGLSVLHANNIIHRDIKPANCLVNHFCSYVHTDENTLRKELRRQGRLVCGIMDFDLSIIVPFNATPSARRLPSTFSWFGTSNQPYDTTQGELDYDPFAFDVGCLGVFFCEEFQHLTPSVPMLAPLLDRMITRDIDRRFTAKQALNFLEGFAYRLTVAEREAAVPRAEQSVSYEKYDRWRCLPGQFLREWSHFREPKLPLWVKILRRICGPDLGYAFVCRFRNMIQVGGIIVSKVVVLEKEVTSWIFGRGKHSS